MAAETESGLLSSQKVVNFHIWLFPKKGAIIYNYMAKKMLIKSSKSNSLSQVLIGATVVVILVAVYQAVTQNDITSIAPTQLFLVAGVLGILGLYLKDEK